MAQNIDTYVVPESAETRRLKRYLDGALVYEWKSSAGGRTLKFSCRSPLGEFFDLMARMGDEGYRIGAAIFAQRATEREIERAVRSHLLTQLATALYDLDPSRDGRIRESEIAHMGRFVNEMIKDLPALHVEWAEDMDADDPQHDLSRKPTAIIRGVFLSPCLDQRRAARFWELAAASDRFPLRIFSDPCRPEEGILFSSYHQRAFGMVFAFAPLPAVERFVAHMREHAIRKLRKLRQEGTDSWFDVAVFATHGDRVSAFTNIVGNIADPVRRAAVTELFGRAI